MNVSPKTSSYWAFLGPRSFNTLFLLFLIMYILTVSGNMAILMSVCTSHQLHTPMYFFLSNFSFQEIWYTTTSVPKVLAILLGKSQTVSFTNCLLQMYLVFSLGCTEYFLLAATAYDCYLTICYPLHYGIIMNSLLSAELALGSWVCDFMAIAIPKILMSSLSFCGPHTINHFFCDIALWITLACNSTWAVELVAFVIVFVVILHSCIITLVSYVYIISTILRIPSAKGRRKAFSTFSSHFIVVLIWYESTIILHVCTSIKEAFDLTKAVHVLNTVVTPVLNPFIYTLHNKEVRESLMRNGRENKLPPTKMTSVNCLHTCPGVLSKNMKKKSKSSLIQEEEKLEKKSKQIKNSFYLLYFLICDRNWNA